MGLITQKVMIRINKSNEDYYKNKGYDTAQKQIEIDVHDLTDHSNRKIDCVCDYCLEPYITTWESYYTGQQRSVKKCCCGKRECISNKMHECADIDRNGVWANQTEQAKSKKAQTMIEKYGAWNASLVPELMKRRDENIMSTYGVSSIWLLPEVKEKRANKIRELYGVDYIGQSEEIKKKKANTFYANGTCVTSTQQLYLHNLLGGELNYPCSEFSIDICFPEEKIAIEYNGSGHDASVKMHMYTEEQFVKKEVYRCKVLKEKSYKRIDIDSKKDYLPEDEIIIKMIDFAKVYFSNNPQRSWIKFSIDDGKVYNALDKDGIPYDFGTLRKIKKADFPAEDQNQETQAA